MGTNSQLQDASAPENARPVPGLLRLDLVNDDDEPVLYIQPDGEQQISLSIENTSSGAISLISKGLLARPDIFHFQLQFRPGTLSAAFRTALESGQGKAFAALATLGWSVHFQDLGTGGDRISLLWKGTTVAPQPGNPSYLLDGVIGATKRVLLPLVDVLVKAGSGSRTTRVLMSYDNLQLADGTALPPGQRIELLNILSRPQALLGGTMARLVAGIKKDQLSTFAEMPLEIKVEGSLLNDGGANSLVIKIKNVCRSATGISAAISLGTEGAADVAPKLYLSMDELFDAVDGSNSDDFTGAKLSTVVSSQKRTWSHTKNDSAKRWYLKPPTGSKFAADSRFAADEELTITFSEVKTTERSGTVYLTVGYEDILEYGEGEYYVPVEIAPLSFVRSNKRETVVIRNGDHSDMNPGGEALFVESAAGRKAARFHGESGVSISGASGESSALDVEGSTSGELIKGVQSGAGRAAHFSGGSGVCIDGVSGDNKPLDVEGTTDRATISAKQKGTGRAGYFSVEKEPDPDTKKSGVPCAFWVRGATDENLLLATQNGEGYSAQFEGGRGVLIKSQSSTPDLTKQALEVKGTSRFSGAVTIDKDLTLSGKVQGNLAVQGRIEDRTGAVMPVGSIIAFGASEPPRGWLLCNGATIPIAPEYDALRGVLSKPSVPDLRGRFILGEGTGGGLSARICHAKGGAENVSLTVEQMPPHQHGLRTAISEESNSGWGKGKSSTWSLKVTDRNSDKAQDVAMRKNPFCDEAGGGEAHENMPPFYVLTYIIKY